MPLWLSIVLAIGSFLIALSQVHMCRVYAGKCDSPTLGIYKGQGVYDRFMDLSIRRGVTWAIFGLLFLFIRRPQVFTYIAAALACRVVLVDFVMLYWFGRGLYYFDITMFKPEAHKSLVEGQLMKMLGVFAFYGLLFGVSAYFLGF